MDKETTSTWWLFQNKALKKLLNSTLQILGETESAAVQDKP